MISTIITALIGLLCTITSSIITFLFTRKKYNEEVDSQRIDNLIKTFDLSQKIYNSNNAILNEKLQNLQKENTALKQEFWDLQKKIAELLPYICSKTDCTKRTLISDKKESKDTDNAANS